MGGSHLRAKKGALCRNGICQHLDLGPNPVSCQEGERQMSVVFCLAVPTKTSCCRKRNWPLRSLSYPSRQVSTYGPSSDVTCPKSDLDSIFQEFFSPSLLPVSLLPHPLSFSLGQGLMNFLILLPWESLNKSRPWIKVVDCINIL